MAGIKDLVRKGGEWLLDEEAPPPEIANEDPETGEITYKKLRDLSLREELFVREYCKAFDKKITGKTLKMKPAEVNGFLQRLPVQAAVRKRARAMAKSADIDQSWVLQNLREITERCMGDGDEGGRFDPANALRSLELIGKSMAMFSDKTINENNNHTVIRIESNVGQIDIGNIGAIAGKIEGPIIEIESYVQEEPTEDE